MTTVSLAPNSITRSQYESRQGQPMHRTYSLLAQDCPGCGALLKPTGYSDWVKGHGIIVTLWDCVAAPSTCEASRLASTFRLETQVVADPVIGPHLLWCAGGEPGWPCECGESLAAPRHSHNVDCGEDRSECQAPVAADGNLTDERCSECGRLTFAGRVCCTVQAPAPALPTAHHRGQLMRRCNDCGFQFAQHDTVLRRHPDYPSRLRLCRECANEAAPDGHRCQLPDVAHRIRGRVVQS